MQKGYYLRIVQAQATAAAGAPLGQWSENVCVGANGKGPHSQQPRATAGGQCNFLGRFGEMMIIASGVAAKEPSLHQRSKQVNRRRSRVWQALRSARDAWSRMVE